MVWKRSHIFHRIKGRGVFFFQKQASLQGWPEIKADMALGDLSIEVNKFIFMFWYIQKNRQAKTCCYTQCTAECDDSKHQH